MHRTFELDNLRIDAILYPSEAIKQPIISTSKEIIMSYYESAQGQTITHDRAIQEIKKHGAFADIADFYKECGKRETYKAQDVLIWLGY
jgi:hypothetical protein